MRRIPEVTLLVFGVVGGWPGAIMCQQIFRHKTQKQPFKTWFFDVCGREHLGHGGAVSFWFCCSLMSIITANSSRPNPGGLLFFVRSE